MAAPQPQPRKRTPADRPPTTPHIDETSPISPDTQTTDYNAISQALHVREHGPASAKQPSNAALEDPPHAQREAAAVDQREKSRWRGVWERFGSVELENRGSVARDHLALERTFLAWLRTSLSFASIGIAITQLFRLNTSIGTHRKSPLQASNNPCTPAQSPLDTYATPNARLRHLGKPLGATFIAISIVMLLIGFHRYFEAQHYVIRGKFPASRGSIVLVSVIAGALILSSLIVILVTAPTAAWES